MSFATKAGIFIGAAAFSGMAVAGTGEASNDLQSRLEAAEAKIAELSAQQDTDWMTEQRSEQIRGIVQDVLADADTRASLQGNGATSGYNDGFFVQSADGKWSVKINGLFQERWNLGSQPSGDGNIVNTSSTAFGFETTRAALNFSGKLGGVAFYNARLDWSPYNDGGVLPGAAAGRQGGLANGQLEWAYGGWHIDDTWSVSMGRQKFDVQRGFMMNAEDQQAIERSLYTYYWATSQITNGLKLSGNMDQMRMNVMVANGAASQATGANPTALNNDHGWSVTGRGEMLLNGTWDQFDHMSSSMGASEGMLWGFGAGYLKNQDGDGESNWLVTSDLAYHADGWNLYGSITYGRNNPAATVAVQDDRNSFGFEVGGGMHLDADNEIYGRWQWLNPGARGAAGSVVDASNTNNSRNLNAATIGWNHFIAGTNCKLSADWTFNFSDSSNAQAFGSGTGGYTGAWANATQSSGSQWLLRTQLQISF